MIAKTGTGQIAGENGYTDSQYTSSVMMAAPADDPKVMVYYAFVSDDIINFDDEPIKNVFKEALVAAGVTGDGESASGNDNSDTWTSYETPSLVNHSLDYANGKLEALDVETVIIGDGSSVVAQYPSAGETITSNDRIMLASDGWLLFVDAEHDRMDTKGCQCLLHGSPGYRHHDRAATAR